MDFIFTRKTLVNDKPIGNNHNSEDGNSSKMPGNLESRDSAAEKKLLRKCDLRIVPVLTLLYVFAFIDRINIGNARIQGLEKDLKMRGSDYNVALCVFFIPYILFEVPSNVMMRKVAPSTWLSLIMVCWGVVTVCMGVTQSFAGLVVCRFFLGLLEAGFFPGCVYLMSMYYKRYELQRRFNVFFAGTILSGAWSGLLAYALVNMAGISGYNGWRWIFIIEGLLTVVVAAIAYPFIADWPETAKFLNADERQLLLRRMDEDVQGARMDRLEAKARKRAFSDWKIYVGILMYLGVSTTGYSLSFFIPTILSELGWTSVRAQVLSIPIYVVAAVVCLVSAFISDKIRHRYSFIILGVLVASTGYIPLLAQRNNVSVAGRYTAVYLILSGAYIAQPISLIWLANNMGGHYKRAIGPAMQIGFGNLSGVIASNIFLTDQRPTYRVGYGVAFACLWLAALAATAMLWGLRRENAKRARGERDDRLRGASGEAQAEAEADNLGDDHPHFRFVY